MDQLPLPRASRATPTLTYINLRGSAEVIRLIFAYKGVEYKDVRIGIANIKEVIPGTLNNKLIP